MRLGGEDGPALGPGKVMLLERIATHGSISAAARDMRMAYRRAWLLVRSLNDGCGAPVVETARGGRGRGGAVLTPLGAELVEFMQGTEDAANALADAEAAYITATKEKGFIK